MRRITGSTVGDFFAAEVATPLGADFFIGTPEPSTTASVAHVIPPDMASMAAGIEPDSIAARTLTNPPLDATASTTIPWRRAEIPAAGGHGNARSVAHVHSVLACGGQAHGVTLLTEAGVNRIFEEQIHTQDLLLPVQAPARARVRSPVAGGPDQPQRAGVLLGWMGRLVGGHRRRQGRQFRLRDESHG